MEFYEALESAEILLEISGQFCLSPVCCQLKITPTTSVLCTKPGLCKHCQRQVEGKRNV